MKQDQIGTLTKRLGKYFRNRRLDRFDVMLACLNVVMSIAHAAANQNRKEAISLFKKWIDEYAKDVAESASETSEAEITLEVKTLNGSYIPGLTIHSDTKGDA